MLDLISKTPWQPGAAAGADGPVLISLTDYRADNWRDVPGIVTRGLRLRRAWPELDGAVGLWLWQQPFRKRSGSVSAWTSEDALMEFVRWPVHVAIMRRYRTRGKLESAMWEMDQLVRSELWPEAERRLTGPPQP
jgi:hypothetical protein